MQRYRELILELKTPRLRRGTALLCPYAPPSSKLKTQNSKLKTQNSKLKTQNSKLKTQNSKLKTYHWS
jgi:cell division protein FtsB